MWSRPRALEGLRVRLHLGFVEELQAAMRICR